MPHLLPLVVCRMRLTVILFLCSAIAWGRITIPTTKHVSGANVANHPALADYKEKKLSSLADVYLTRIKRQLNSLGESVAKGDAFHLDALVYSLNNSRSFLEDIAAFPEHDWDGDESTYDLSSELINAISRPGQPGISSNLTSPNTLRALSAEYSRNYDIIYVDNIFDEWTLQQLLIEVDRLWKSEDIEPNCNLNGVDRLGGYVHHSDSLPLESHKSNFYSLIYGNEPLMIWASAVVGEALFASDFPIELREYGNNSRGMGCHADIQMYRNESLNIEVVVTLSNYGKCEVSWYDRENVKHSIWPKPNSITLVKPNAAVHCVSDTFGGYREILKFILVGDYVKHPNFTNYVRNKCSAVNPNVRMLSSRREKRLAAPTVDPEESKNEDEL